MKHINYTGISAGVLKLLGL